MNTGAVTVNFDITNAGKFILITPRQSLHTFTIIQYGLKDLQ